MITVDELKDAIHQRVTAYLNNENPLTKRSTQTLNLIDSLGHVLAEPIKASFDIPRQNLSVMDGFAIAKGSDLQAQTAINIIGESCAGTPFGDHLRPNQGVRIFTGAVVPDDCDTVVMQEHTNLAELKASATIAKHQPYTITLMQAINRGTDIRYQGEEVQTDETVLDIGKRINPTDISLLASLGIAQLKVFAPLKVGIIASGDELVTIGIPLQRLAQIYNSNTPTLKALLTPLPVTIHDYGIIPDNLEQTRQTITQAVSECDVIISSAGVSVGDYDFLTTVIAELGKINHYKVAMKPGKPFVFGEFTRSNTANVLYFGLPGNPLSTVVGCLQFILPALWQLAGVISTDQPKTLQLNAITTHPLKKVAGRQDYQRAIFHQQADGSYQVTPLSAQESHRIKQLSQANCLIVLPKDNTGVQAGEIVTIEPFSWVTH